MQIYLRSKLSPSFHRLVAHGIKYNIFGVPPLNTPFDHAAFPCILGSIFCHLYAEKQYHGDCTSGENVDFAITLSHMLSLSKTIYIVNICVHTVCNYWIQCRVITGTLSPSYAFQRFAFKESSH